MHFMNLLRILLLINLVVKFAETQGTDFNKLKYYRLCLNW